MNKLNHFRNCGRATAHLQPNVTHFYNEEAQADIVERVNLGKFTLAETFKGGHPGPEATCTASLHCARPDSTHSNVATDITGVVGFVCGHTVPVLGAFVDMFTHENFSYYILLLTRLIISVCTATAVGT